MRSGDLRHARIDVARPSAGRPPRQPPRPARSIRAIVSPSLPETPTASTIAPARTESGSEGSKITTPVTSDEVARGAQATRRISESRFAITSPSAGQCVWSVGSSPTVNATPQLQRTRLAKAPVQSARGDRFGCLEVDGVAGARDDDQLGVRQPLGQALAERAELRVALPHDDRRRHRQLVEAVPHRPHDAGAEAAERRGEVLGAVREPVLVGRGARPRATGR